MFKESVKAAKKKREKNNENIRVEGDTRRGDCCLNKVAVDQINGSKWVKGRWGVTDEKKRSQIEMKAEERKKNVLARAKNSHIYNMNEGEEKNNNNNENHSRSHIWHSQAISHQSAHACLTFSQMCFDYTLMFMCAHIILFLCSPLFQQ